MLHTANSFGTFEDVMVEVGVVNAIDDKLSVAIYVFLYLYVMTTSPPAPTPPW